MKIYKHAFSGVSDDGVEIIRPSHVVYSAAEGPVEGAIVAQAYALRRGLQWKRFKQTLEGVISGPVNAFAWNDDTLRSKRPTSEDRADHATRQRVMKTHAGMYRNTAAQKPAAVAAYRVDEPGTVQYCSPPDADPCGCEGRVHGQSATGREYTFDDACRIAWQMATAGEQREWKYQWLSALELPRVDHKVVLSVSEHNSDDAQRCRISLGSSYFRECQREMERFFNCRAIKFEKVSPSTYLVRWRDMFKFMGMAADAAQDKVCYRIGVL